MFPKNFTFSIADWVNGWVDALVSNYGDVFRHISDTLLWAIVNLEGLLRATPWWLVRPSSRASPGTPPVKS